MGYGFESNEQSMEQSEEIRENVITSEQLSETEEVIEDGYEDCEAKIEKREEENPELLEDNYYDDCGRESDGLDVGEATPVQNNESKSELNFSERLDLLLEKDEVSHRELSELSEENSENLSFALKEKGQINDEINKKFDEVLSKTRGSEEYKEALKDYNDFKDYRINLDEKITLYEQQQEVLNKKGIELRDAQIQKGTEAVAVSSVMFTNVSSLQERYDQTFYDRKPDKIELASIREDSSVVIKELTVEKNVIKQGMDAKMDEITEYVHSKKFVKYDAAQDFHYQQLSTEYVSMKECYDKVRYSIVKLDENNKEITEQLGDQYVSIAEIPLKSRLPEINNGNDNPDETNYFIDEVKATEILSQFNQADWERLNIGEQKKVIEKLADYNGEILGVKDKPRIIYYNAETPCKFGGYSAEQNAIYINEYNMGDALEIADTISHEYRHKYQHERAEKLETERDLEFKECFNNYIRAEDDYQGYKEQLVESDARAYAQAVKDKIVSCSDIFERETENYTDYNVLGTKFTTLNPEKGAVFEKISLSELPDDFEQKEKEKYKEVLESKELDELKTVVAVHYENGKQIGNRVTEFNTYKEHYDIENGHIEKVRVKSLQAADAFENHFSQNDYNGLYSSDIDRRTVEVMAIYHDTGMDGNIKAEYYEAERAEYLSDKTIRESYVEDILAEKEKEAKRDGKLFDRAKEEAKATVKFEKEGFENHFRANHSLESAIHVLRDRESIDKLSVNADEVALGCLVHSKSNSGLRNIANEVEWKVAIDRLQKKVDDFNVSHPNEQIHFNSSFLVNDDGSFKQEKLAEMRSEAIILRIGDGSGHDMSSRTSQNGKAIEFSLEKKAIKEELPSDVESKLEKGEYEPYFIEVQSADVWINGMELNNNNDPKGTSRMFIVGEGNFKSLSCEVDQEGTIKQNFELCEGNAFPLSTQYCIEERLNEYKTAKPLNYMPVVKLGSNCSDEVYNSYLVFADRVEEEYKVKLEVVR